MTEVSKEVKEITPIDRIEDWNQWRIGLTHRLSGDFDDKQIDKDLLLVTGSMESDLEGFSGKVEVFDLLVQIKERSTHTASIAIEVLGVVSQIESKVEYAVNVMNAAKQALELIPELNATLEKINDSHYLEQMNLSADQLIKVCDNIKGKAVSYKSKIS